MTGRAPVVGKAQHYWLFKSEPHAFSIDDLYRAPRRTTHWDGVRNYQARNTMRDHMRRGDLGFFYHSGGGNPAIVGVVEVVREAYPDHTAFDPQSPYYDAKSTPEQPRWFMVDVRYCRRLSRAVPLRELRQHAALADMALLKRGSRLSITPVRPNEWEFILGLSRRRAESRSSTGTTRKR